MVATWNAKLVVVVLGVAWEVGLRWHTVFVAEEFSVLFLLAVAVEIFHKQVFCQILIACGGVLSGVHTVVGEILDSLVAVRFQQFHSAAFDSRLVVGALVLNLALHFANVGNHLRITVIGLVCHQIVHPESGIEIEGVDLGGRHELADTTKDAIIDYGSLIYLALQRSRTAREAIKVMTDLVAKYGYCSEGESFSIGDPNELWVMEMIGKGGKEKGAVWVAIRIPDDCISAHANQSRIYRIPLKDKQNCMYSKDVISFARKMGYFSGKDEDFEFSRAYSPADFGTLRGCDARAWSYFNRFKSGMDAYLPFINGKKGAEVMPLYVKPDRKLSCRDVQNMMRDHFEGTPFDMTKDPGAKNYFDVPYR